MTKDQKKELNAKLIERIGEMIEKYDPAALPKLRNTIKKGSLILTAEISKELKKMEKKEKLRAKKANEKKDISTKKKKV